MMLNQTDSNNNNAMISNSTPENLYDDIVNQFIELQKEVVSSTTSSSSPSTATTSSLVRKTKSHAIRNLFNLRMKQQKLEFICSWVFIILLAGIMITKEGEDEAKAQKEDDLPMAIFTMALLHVKIISVYTRIFAFAVDFLNTRDKLGAVKGNLMGLPSWLLYHHIGVYLSGVVIDIFLTPRNYVEALVISLSLQSTNNTWTKKYSYAMYWVNVLVGVISSWYFLVALRDGEDALLAKFGMMASLLSAYTGAGMLAMESFQCKKKKKNEE